MWRMPIVENAEALKGKIITSELVGTKAFNALARTFWEEGEGVDAEKLNKLEPWEIQGHTQHRHGQRFHGLGEKGMEKVIQALNKLAEE